MTPAETLIKSEILKRCNALGIKPDISIAQAEQAIKSYRIGSYSGRPSKLVPDAVANAKKVQGKIKKDKK